MNARLARRLTGLYPPAWRARYRDEFQIFLENHPSNLPTILNVIGWAIYERVLSLGEFNMDSRRKSLTFMLYAYLAAVAAGVNFYWTVDDTPLATAMHNRPALAASWNMVEAGSLLALAAVAMVGIPVLASMMRMAFAARRWDIVSRLAVAPCAALMILMWIVTGTMLAGGHWAPTPWDVGGGWIAPPGWPPLPARWALSSVTFLLMAAGLIVSAIGVQQAIARSDLSGHNPLRFASSSMLLAASVAVMALGVLTWGWFAQRYLASDFHARNGGFFGGTNFASWAASCFLFLAAALTAAIGARSALTWKSE